jgi:predicted nucleic acid-binding protein
VASYFLDTSAFAKLYHQETGSHHVERLVEHPGSIVLVSPLSLIEMESVFAIKVRTGELSPSGQELARRRLRADVAQGRILVGPPIEERHYRRARRLLRRYGVEMALRTLDSLQLALALDLHQSGQISVIVAADQRLCRVAEACGCSTINPADPGVLIP